MPGVRAVPVSAPRLVHRVEALHRIGTDGPPHASHRPWQPPRSAPRPQLRAGHLRRETSTRARRPGSTDGYTGEIGYPLCMVTFNQPAGDVETLLAAGEGAPAVIVFGLIVIGLLVLLVWIVWQVGARRRRDAPPRADEQPRRPDHQTHYESRLEPDDFDTSEGHEVPGRLTPHELHGYGNMGSRPVPEKKPPRDSDESGGAFGSGGHGG